MIDFSSTTNVKSDLFVSSSLLIIIDYVKKTVII